MFYLFDVRIYLNEVWNISEIIDFLRYYFIFNILLNKKMLL